MHKKQWYSYCLLLLFACLMLTSCTPHTVIETPETNSFFEEVIKESDSISKAKVSHYQDIYLVVEYSLTTDDFSAAEREKLFIETRDFFLSAKIKKLLIEEIGEEYKDHDWLFNEGFHIRFQNHNSDKYWVYSQVDDKWVLTDNGKSQTYKASKQLRIGTDVDEKISAAFFIPAGLHQHLSGREVLPIYKDV